MAVFILNCRELNVVDFCTGPMHFACSLWGRLQCMAPDGMGMALEGIDSCPTRKECVKLQQEQEDMTYK